MKLPSLLMAGVTVICILPLSLSAQRMAPTAANLQVFIDGCPQNDPYYPILRRDFQILRDGAPSTQLSCTEPYSKIPAFQITDELTLIQSLRFAYYMDMGRSGHLPWTSLRLYDWFKSRIAGINIDTRLAPGSVAAFCCSTINGQQFIVVAPIANDLNRQYRQTANGLAAQVMLIAHEVRHSEGSGYSHVSCCGIPGGCDQTYDETNLSAYGIQYYLAKQFLTGSINLGYSCDQQTSTQLGNQFRGLANVYPIRFCDTKPATLPLPPSPGGACVPACRLALGTLTSSIPSGGGSFTLGVLASTQACGWTADSPDSWITVTSGKSAAGDGLVAYSAAPSQPVAFRTGNLIAAGFKVPLTQTTSPCSLSCSASVAISGQAGAPLQFSATVNSSGCAPVQFDWDFGDSSPHASVQNPTHSYANGGTYSWALAASSTPASCQQIGAVRINPTVTITSVASAAPGTSAIASGSWVTIYGDNLAGSTRTWGSADFAGKNLPLSLDGVSVKINNRDAAVYYISPTQLNVQAPSDTATGAVPVLVTTKTGTAIGTATLQTFAPALFLFPNNYVAAVHADGAYVGSSNLFTGAAAARPGETVLLFGTGFGPTNPPVSAGQVLTGPAPLADSTQLHFRIGGKIAQVIFAGLSSAGLYQFNVVIPQVSDGDVEVLADIGGVTTPSGKLITVKGENSPTPPTPL